MPIDPSQLPPTESVSPVTLFGGVYAAASLAGLSALLRSRQKLTRRAVVSAMLNSGFIAVIIAMAWYSQYRDTNLHFLVAVSLLAGLGGSVTIDFAFTYVRRKLGMPMDSDTDNGKADDSQN